MSRNSLHIISLLILMVLMTGCFAQHLDPNAFVVNEETLKKRAVQSQRFEKVERKQLMSSVIGVLQDLEFNIDEGDSDLGVFVGSKARSAFDSKQQFSFFLQVIGGSDRVVVEKSQRFRISIIIYPIGKTNDQSPTGNYLVRTNFQRIVWNNLNQVSRAESLDAPEFFRDFFSRLSKSLFLDKANL